jgi:energy-coupling factor transporter ATP-binding protein EcfA2
MLWAHVASGKSLMVIGGPSGLGKSTLLHALLPALPPGRRQIYLRGCYETFAYQREPGYSPAGTTILVNEMSPHLPIYLWGPAVRRALEAGEEGSQILATAHGQSVVEFIRTLTGSPLRLPARLLGTLGLVALLEPSVGGSGRTLSGVWQLSSERNGVAVDQLQHGDLPAGVTAEHLAEFRAAVLSLLESEHDGLDLERTRAGE